MDNVKDYQKAAAAADYEARGYERGQGRKRGDDLVQLELGAHLASEEFRARGELGTHPAGRSPGIRGPAALTRQLGTFAFEIMFFKTEEEKKDEERDEDEEDEKCAAEEDVTEQM